MLLNNNNAVKFNTVSNFACLFVTKLGFTFRCLNFTVTRPINVKPAIRKPAFTVIKLLSQVLHYKVLDKNISYLYKPKLSYISI